MATCQGCGRRLGQTDRFCNACGAPAGSGHPAYQSYPQQSSGGYRPTSRKNKTISILLAVFLTYWTWLYTYKRDAWKFWLGLILSSLPIVVATFFMEFYVSNVSWLPDQLLIDLSYALPVTVWALAVIDTLRRNRQWYDYY